MAIDKKCACYKGNNKCVNGQECEEETCFLGRKLKKGDKDEFDREILRRSKKRII